MKYYIGMFFILLNLTNLFSQEKISLQLNLQEGNEYISTYKLASSSFQKVYGEQQSVKKNTERKISFKILPPITDSTFYIKATLLKTRYVFDINQDIMVWDSDSFNNNDIILQDASLKNIGEGYNFEITKKGRIISVNKITLRNYAEEKNKLFNSNEIINDLKTFFITLPNKNITNDDFWISNDTIFGEILNIYSIKNTFSASTDSTYILNNFAEISSNKNKAKLINTLHIYFNIKGKHQAETILNKESCMVYEKKIIETSTGKSEIKYSKDSGVIYTSPIKIEKIISIKTIKL